MNWQRFIKNSSKNNLLTDENVRNKILVGDDSSFSAKEVEQFGLADIVDSDYIRHLAQ